MTDKVIRKCPVSDVCGGCQLQGFSYEQQLQQKQQEVEKVFGKLIKAKPILGADDPCYYRNKAQISFGYDYKKRIIAGNYVESTHTIVPVTECMITNKKANAIFNTIIQLVRSFKLTAFDEQAMQGLMRHVMVRTSHDGEEVMVVLVTGTPVFPKKKGFMEALLKRHPEITTIVQNVNNRRTSMILGQKNIIWYGHGYISDELCGCTFRLSPQSFYQINHDQTEKLYRTAIEAAQLRGDEVLLDAYCGIGTIGIVASGSCKEVIGVELNRSAVSDAVKNARYNEVKNISFYCEDAGQYMQKMAAKNQHVDVVIMDPPRSGSDNKFLSSVVKLQPEKVVYVSCNIHTQIRDVNYLLKKGYRIESLQPVDMFPFTTHVETVVLLSRK